MSKVTKSTNLKQPAKSARNPKGKQPTSQKASVSSGFTKTARAQRLRNDAVQLADGRLLSVFLYPHGPVERSDSLHSFPGATEISTGKRGLWESIQTSLATTFKGRSKSDEELFAVLPSNFSSLTQLHLESLQALLQDHRDHGLYFFNLNPVDEAIFPNPWSRLFLDVKDFVPLIALLLKVVGEGEAQSNHLRGGSDFHSFPAAIGTGSFWAAFFHFANTTLSQVEQEASSELRQLLSLPVSSVSGQVLTETYRGLLCRQMFPYFLRQQKDIFRPLKLLVPFREQTLNTHARTLRQLREASVRSKAPWLGAAWLNYRNLYLLGVNGKPWCDKNLEVISPRFFTA